MSASFATIDWCNLSSYSDDFLLQSFNELASQLQSNYPQLIRPRFELLPAGLIEKLPHYLVSNLPGNVRDESLYAELRCRRVFVYCDGNEDFAVTFQRQNPLAHWGVAIPCCLAIAWHPDKFLLWHEALHLLDAKDCYNKFGINKCTDPQCIMQRAPSHSTCGDRLKLCSRNLKRIRNFASTIAYHEESFDTDDSHHSDQT